jgi:Arc/MetJ family transcription regulator
LVEIDDEVLEQAGMALGTSTLAETVNTALHEAVRAAHRRSLTREDLERAGGMLKDLGDPKLMAEAWD